MSRCRGFRTADQDEAAAVAFKKAITPGSYLIVSAGTVR
jgi:hypothetical protein